MIKYKYIRLSLVSLWFGSPIDNIIKLESDNSFSGFFSLHKWIGAVVVNSRSSKLTVIIER